MTSNKDEQPSKLEIVRQKTKHKKKLNQITNMMMKMEMEMGMIKKMN